ncbi:MAG: acyl-CoA desaturase [Bacteroidetes bacterium]|nr:MAG: acyl-CoA desaturase [Bacteroidota bacterium]
MPQVTFRSPDNTFQKELRRAVDAYFVENNIAPTGDYRLYLKTGILIASAITFYLLLMFKVVTGPVALGTTLVLGFVLACIGFNVMHDACHGSYSASRRINDIMGLTLNALGGNERFWKQKHNVIHHTYTNVEGVDDDIHKSPFLRMCETQRFVPMHALQYIYMFPLYCLGTLFWIWFNDFKSYFAAKIHTTERWEMSLTDHVIFWVSKILYVVFYLVIPISVWGVGNFLIGYLLMNAVMGFTLSIVFQLAHVVEDTIFQKADETIKKNVIEVDWTVFQLQTTVNFGASNPVLSWFVGGLNYQVEHHLFPKVSHVHYPAVSKIVREVCQKYNVPYLEFQTFGDALQSHIRHMKALGSPDYVGGSHPHAALA